MLPSVVAWLWQDMHGKCYSRKWTRACRVSVCISASVCVCVSEWVCVCVTWKTLAAALMLLDARCLLIYEHRLVSVCVWVYACVCVSTILIIERFNICLKLSLLAIGFCLRLFLPLLPHYQLPRPLYPPPSLTGSKLKSLVACIIIRPWQIQFGVARQHLWGSPPKVANK